MAAEHVKLLAFAQKSSIRRNFYGLIQLVNSSPEGLTEVFGDYLTGEWIYDRVSTLAGFWEGCHCTLLQFPRELNRMLSCAQVGYSGPLWTGSMVLWLYCSKFWNNFMTSEETWSECLLLLHVAPPLMFAFNIISGHAHKQLTCTKPLPRGISVL